MTITSSKIRLSWHLIIENTLLCYQVLKVLNGADEYVMAFEASFSMKADSHLVCIQTEQGYKTQAINIQNQPRQGWCL